MLDIRYSLEINKNGETVNTFTGKGENALAEMVKNLSQIRNKRNYHNLVKATVKEDKINEYVRMQLIYKINENTIYTYNFIFTGSDIHKVYNF